MNVTAPAASPEHLNQLMIDAIAGARPVGTSGPRVLGAICAVPRHAFVPGADLTEAYNPDLAVITKRGTAGAALSCASVPYLVAAMLEQLDIHDGHRVFEAGAGTGWNAALLATLAGPSGHVSTTDPEITAQATANLERAGFTSVHVATGDAGLGVPEHAPYDRAIITIGSLDIPPAWFRSSRRNCRTTVSVQPVGSWGPRSPGRLLGVMPSSVSETSGQTMRLGGATPPDEEMTTSPRQMAARPSILEKYSSPSCQRGPSARAKPSAGTRAAGTPRRRGRPGIGG